jgi:hypothetical protein
MTKIVEGDTLICVNDKVLGDNVIAPTLNVGDEYPAKKVFVCGCGQEHVDVGITSQYNYVRCYICKEDLPNSDSIHWCNSIRFEKK